MEELFQLTFHGKMSMADAQRLPIYHRKWLINRTVKEYKEINERQKAATKG